MVSSFFDLKSIIFKIKFSLLFKDISIKRESCKIQPAKALPQYQSANLVGCSFENNNLCNWKNDALNEINWQIITNQTDSYRQTGPESGAQGSRYYIFVNSRMSNENSRARLVSPVVPRPNSDNYCLSFFYHMWGVIIKANFFFVVKKFF